MENILVPKRLCEEVMVRSVFLGQETIAGLFAAFFGEEKADPILRSIIFSSAPDSFTPSSGCENYFMVRWKAHISQTFECEEKSETDIPQDFYYIILKQIKAQWSSALHEIVTSDDIYDISRQKSVTKVVYQCFQQNPALFRALIPTIDFVLNSVEPKEFFRRVFLDSFAMKPFMSEHTIQAFPIEKLSGADLPVFFTNIFHLKLPSVQNLLQSLIFYSERSMSRSDLFQQDSPFPLMNKSIVKKQHFADIVIKAAQWKLLNHNFNSFVETMRKYKGLLGYVFISVYEDIKNEPDFMQWCSKLTNYDAPCDIINRFLNDDVITSYINKKTKLEMVPSDFALSSVSQLLYPVMQSVDLYELDEISHLHYLCISDHDRTEDFGFIFAYRAIYNAVNYISSGEQEQISEFLMMIEDEEKRNACVVDIFSLIFLQKDGKFVCSIEMAENLLMAVSGFLNDSKFIKAATGRLLFAKIIGSHSIESSLVATQEAVIKMIGLKEPDIALNMAESIPLLRDIVHMMLLRKDPTLQKPKIYGLERFLSTGEEKEEIIDNEYAREIVKRRKREEDPLDIVKTAKIKRGIDQFQFFGQSCINFGGLFGSLMEYRYTYSRLMRRAKINKKRRMKSSDLVDVIVQTSYLSEETSLKALLGPNALEIILQNIKSDDVNDFVYKIIEKKCKPAAIALAMSNPSLDESFFKENCPSFKYNAKKDVDVDFKELTDHEFIKMFSTEKPIDFDLMEDLYYRNPDLFKKEVIRKMNEFSPTEMKFFLPFSDKKSLTFLQKIGIQRMDPNRIIQKLLSSSMFHQLDIFIEDFSLIDKFMPIFSQFVAGNIEQVFLTSAQFLFKYLPHFQMSKQYEIKQKIAEIKTLWKEDSNSSKDANRSNSVIDTYTKNKKKYGRAVSALKTLIMKSNDEVFIINECNSLFKKFPIDNSEDEYEIFLLLRELRRFNNEKMNALLSFVGNFICSRYDIFYDLSDPKSLVDICFKVDFLQTLMILCKAYSIPFSTYGEQLSINCVYLGQTKPSMELLSGQKKSKEFSRELIRVMMSKMQLCIPEAKDLKLFTEKLNNNLIQIPKYVNCTPSHTLASDVLMQLEEYGPAMALCAQMGEFEEAFDIFNISSHSVEIFGEYIVLPAIEYGNETWLKLWDFMALHEEYNPIVSKFISEIEKLDLINTIVYIEKSLKMDTMLVEGLIQMIKDCKTWEKERIIVGEIQEAIKRAMKGDRISLDTKRNLVNIKNKCVSQQKIIDVCVKREITFSPNITILNNADDALSTAIVLMRLYELEMVLDMVPYFASLFTFEDICRKLIFNLMKSGEESLVRFMKGIGKKEVSIEYELVISVLMTIIAEEIESNNEKDKSRNVTIDFIKKCIPSDYIKCKCYCQLGIVDEAFAVAKMLKNKELYSLVMVAAQQSGDKKTESKCAKLLK